MAVGGYAAFPRALAHEAVGFLAAAAQTIVRPGQLAGLPVEELRRRRVLLPSPLVLCAFRGRAKAPGNGHATPRPPHRRYHAVRVFIETRATRGESRSRPPLPPAQEAQGAKVSTARSRAMPPLAHSGVLRASRVQLMRGLRRTMTTPTSPPALTSLPQVPSPAGRPFR